MGGWGVVHATGGRAWGAIAHEWTDIVHERDATQFALHSAAAISGSLLPQEGIGVALAVIAALTIIGIILSRHRIELWKSVGIAYAGLPALALVVLRSDISLGMAAVFWLLIVVWASDIAAYFAGRIIGGPKLAPVISPNKTWAGALGAVVGSALAGGLAAYVLIGTATVPAFLAIALSIAAQAGDLFKSALKRKYGVKDLGTLIPGHGGVIDRVDGLVAAAIAAAVIGVLRAGPTAAGQGLLVW